MSMQSPDVEHLVNYGIRHGNYAEKVESQTNSVETRLAQEQAEADLKNRTGTVALDGSVVIEGEYDA